MSCVLLPNPKMTKVERNPNGKQAQASLGSNKSKGKKRKMVSLRVPIAEKRKIIILSTPKSRGLKPISRVVIPVSTSVVKLAAFMFQKPRTKLTDTALRKRLTASLSLLLISAIGRKTKDGADGGQMQDIPVHFRCSISLQHTKLQKSHTLSNIIKDLKVGFVLSHETMMRTCCEHILEHKWIELNMFRNHGEMALLAGEVDSSQRTNPQIVCSIWFHRVNLFGSEGGHCGILIFVQISTIAKDLGRSLCSLNLASRVRRIELGRTRKRVDSTDHFKFKQTVEELNPEKDGKKLYERLQLLQIMFTARDRPCRSQQAKMRDLENQSAEERRTSAASAAKPSVLSSLQSQNVQNVKKTALVSSEPREQLRRVTNFLPPPSPLPVSKLGTAPPNSTPEAEDEKDPGSSTRSSTKVVMRPRCVSIAMHHPTVAIQTNQPRPKRQRVPIVTVRPVNSSIIQMQSGGTLAGPLSAIYPRRKSRIFSLMPELTSSGPASEAAAVGASKFLSSHRRQSQVDTLKLKHPPMVEVQRRLASCEEAGEASPAVYESKFMGGSPE